MTTATKERDKVCPACGKAFRVYPCRVEVAKYCSRHCQNSNQKRENNRNWRGGEYTHKRRQRQMVSIPQHTRAGMNGYLPHYVSVMEQHLGRSLKPDEVVHHRDGNSMNDDISNLELMTVTEHRRLHANQRRNPTTGRFRKKGEV